MSDTEPQTEYIFSQETIDTLSNLGVVLRRINARMKREGYSIVNDKIINVSTGKEYEPKKR